MLLLILEVIDPLTPMGIDTLHDVEPLSGKIGRVIVRPVFQLGIVTIADLAEVHFAVS